MTGPRSTTDPAIDDERWRRIEELRRKDREALLTLPELNEERVRVGRKSVALTTYVERHDDGRLLVMVRSDEQKLFGIISYGATDGFWVLPNGDIAEATDTEVMDFFA